MSTVHENEVIMLILGVIVLVFVIIFQERIKRIIHAWKMLLISFYILIAGWFFTIAESFILEYYFNLLEHLCYATSSVLIFIWCCILNDKKSHKKELLQ